MILVELKMKIETLKHDNILTNNQLQKIDTRPRD